ncbi:hypothetical protein AZE42_13726 [Rhizopogon vesiculosus]|uniref:Uncharacterized protein n=1 Tax=Rhizopogon vesiculosus TaxID=180088 RepID=A0A1J8PTR1_9AGAM|nr:hypothetical protein AZE42_13726 [Rhizopogon vesiculosus]
MLVPRTVKKGATGMCSELLSVMYQVPVPECPEETGTPRPAERQAIFILSIVQFCSVTSPYTPLPRI